MNRFIPFLTALALVVLAAPLAAQQGDMAPDTTAVEVPEDPAAETPDDEAAETPDDEAAETPDEPVADTPDAPVGETPVAPDADAPAADAAVTHDWEFALAPTDNATGAAGTVKVTEGDTENTLIVEVTGLPPVDSLDQPDRDVSTYTVWIVPSKEQVNESTMAGVLVVEPEGIATFEATTTLESFGVIVTATPDGAPETISGVPVLTGIPVTAQPDATPAEGEVDTPDPAVTPAPEAPPAAPETPEPAPTPQEGQLEMAPDAEVEADVEATPER